MNIFSNDLNAQIPQNHKYGRYQVIKLLGEGAMGRVFLAEDQILDRLVALKVIALERILDSEMRHEFFERFSFEARASAKLNHPSIVTVHDAGQESGIPWIAFEFVKGQRLDQQIKNENRFSFKKIRTICRQLVSALNYAHGMSIIHRDIKPQNILLDERTQIAKLADFGIAKAPSIGLTREGNNIGSPGYMSPEQIEGVAIDARSDLFSFGIVLYEMLTGIHPFIKESVPATFYATLNCVFTPVEKYRPDVPDDLVSIVNGLLQSDRSKRTNSAAELLSIIDSTSVATTDKLTEDFNAKSLKFTLPKQLKSKMLLFVSSLEKISYKIYSMSKRVCFRCFLVLVTFFSSYKKSILNGITIILPLFFIFYFAKITCRNGMKNSLSGKSNTALDKIKYEIDSLIIKENIDSIQKSISFFIEQYGNNNEIRFIQSRLALKKRDYSLFRQLMHEIAKNGGNDLLIENKTVILDDVEVCFSNGKASAELIIACSQPLKHIFIPQINEWLGHSHYWIRWNTVSICRHLDRKVDMVKVYMLDLQTSSSIRTRIRAAEKLGELGDRRAVPVLEEVGNRGIRDPFVSNTASNVLQKYFYKK